MKYILPTIILFFSSLSILSAQEIDLVELVLQAESKHDLYVSSNPTMEQKRNYWSIPKMLVKIVESNPTSEKNWNALHKFRKFLDAGVTNSFNRECLFLMQRNPLIFYQRYVNGDDQALNRMKDAIIGDTFNGDSLEVGNKIILNSITLIKAANTNQLDQKKIFLQNIKNQYKIRQKLFKLQ